MDWTEVLVEDVVLLILHSLDPLALFLYGMTSKRNKRRRVTEILTRGNLPPLYNIRLLMECHGTVVLYQWAETYWGQSSGRSCNVDNLLRVRNFELAAWLIKERGYERSYFEIFLRTHDYEGMTWCYEQGYKLYITDLWTAWTTRDRTYIKWFAGKKYTPRPATRDKRYLDPDGYYFQ